MPQARLDALHALLAGLVARPEPGILVLACADTEVFYLAHALEQLDERSPADRFLLHVDNLGDDYLASLFLAVERPPPDASIDPALALHTLCTDLLADLPPGDHHLVVALLPTEIHDPSGFTALAEPLLQLPLDPRLRLIFRVDRESSNLFALAAASRDPRHLAHTFSLSHDQLLDAVRRTSHDPRADPNDRAQALLQLACQDLGYGRHSDALARCDAAHGVTTTPSLRLLALAFKADVLRHSGDTPAAIDLATSTLHRAVELQLHPIVLHLALALGDLTRALGRPADAAACFALAETAASQNPVLQARARALRAELPPC